MPIVSLWVAPVVALARSKTSCPSDFESNPHETDIFPELLPSLFPWLCHYSCATLPVVHSKPAGICEVAHAQVTSWAVIGSGPNAVSRGFARIQRICKEEQDIYLHMRSESADETADMVRVALRLSSPAAPRLSLSCVAGALWLQANKSISPE